jgi:L-alanine-DL-glutamate epimerase-like enolase superfamily enzyme
MDRVDAVRASVWRVPTDAPEADGTLAWNATTVVLVEVGGAGETGLGWSYTDGGAARVVQDLLRPVVEGRDVAGVEGAWQAMVAAVRNVGATGVAASAIAAVDIALWDLKARRMGVPLVTLLGAARDAVALYGSGGFTSYDDARLREQLGAWVAEGFGAVKMKVGSEPARDVTRVRVARDAIGAARLFVDANGAWTRKQALAFAEAFAGLGVSWLEEPVRADDEAGTRLVRDRAPPGMDVAAGEYGWDLPFFARLVGLVDVVQADATRCLGITGFRKVAALCEAARLPLSAHTAPAVHLHVGCAVAPLVHVEWFHDHARIEAMFFDGVRTPTRGTLAPDLSRPGLGLTLRRPDIARWAVP